MNVTNIVLISGKQGSGKSTTAEALTNMIHGQTTNFARIVKFADPIYVLHEYLLNKMETFTGIPRDKKDGKLLQLLGTEWGRETFGYDIWILILKRRIEELRVGFVIIDDCRFENEFDAFPNALRVRLIADQDIRKIRCDSWRKDTFHPSETGLDKYQDEGKFDLYIDTDCIDSTPEHAATLIMAQLKKNNWKEKRK